MTDNKFPMGMRSVVDPFNHDLYIGGDFKVSWFMHKCAVELGKGDFVCRLKYDFSFPDALIRDNMSTCIRESYRCLVFISREYGNDAFVKKEMKLLKEKACRFTNVAVRAIYVDENIKKKCFDELLTASRKDLTVKFDLIIKTLKCYLSERSPLNLTLLPNLNSGIGAAFGYFYGYLRIVLPDMINKFFKQTLERNMNLIKKAVPKLLIIVPEDCKCRIYFNVEGKVETTNKYVITAASRAGTKCRDYKSSVHKILDSTGTEFFFVGEFATPTLTMYESYLFGKCGFTYEQLCDERNAFFTTLNAILDAHKETQNTYKLLYWRNYAENDDNAFYKFLLEAVLKEVEDQSVDTTVNVEKYHKKNTSIPSEIQTYDLHETPIPNPKATYDSNIYSFEPFDVKGLCISFIYSKGFQSKQRNGYQMDKENITKTFEGLQFEVDTCVDFSEFDLRNKLNDLKNSPIEKYGCIACCISSHGRIGQIETTTSWISISDIMEYFYDDKCSSFKDKPKIMFIQCCLIDAYESQSLKWQDTNLIPKQKDFFVCYSCLPGTFAYRSPNFGSVYFQIVCECLLPSMELGDCLDKIAEMTTVKIASISKTKQQHPFLVKSFTKSVYL